MNTDFLATPQRCCNLITTNISPLLQNNIKKEIDSDISRNKPNITDDVKYDIRNDLKEIFKDVPKNSTKTSMLIIDKCIKIEPQEILQQIQKPLKDLRGITKDMFRKSKSKKTITAKQLLKRFNKR